MIASVPSDPTSRLREVVADDVLHDLAAGADDLARRQHGLESEHVLLRDAVLERARPARALGDVAADRRLPQAGRIRRIEQADALDGVLQVAGDHVRLDDREQVRLVDLEDAVHPLEAEDDAAAHRHRAAGVARCRRRAARAASASRCRACAIAATSAAVAGQHDDVGGMPARRAVDAVGRQRVRVDADVRVADDAAEPGEMS